MIARIYLKVSTNDQNVEGVIAPIETDTSNLRPSHSNRVNESLMARIEIITSARRRWLYSSQKSSVC
mgnify:CR=1 FL=1